MAAVSQRKVLLYDKAGEEHFNLISALHKSLRESDPDASLYWLRRMLEAGEDPRYVARRMVRFASEDIGLADPQALQHSLAAWQAQYSLPIWLAGDHQAAARFAEKYLYQCARLIASENAALGVTGQCVA